MNAPTDPSKAPSGDCARTRILEYCRWLVDNGLERSLHGSDRLPNGILASHGEIARNLVERFGGVVIACRQHPGDEVGDAPDFAEDPDNRLYPLLGPDRRFFMDLCSRWPEIGEYDCLDLFDLPQKQRAENAYGPREGWTICGLEHQPEFSRRMDIYQACLPTDVPAAFYDPTRFVKVAEVAPELTTHLKGFQPEEAVRMTGFNADGRLWSEAPKTGVRSLVGARFKAQPTSTGDVVRAGETYYAVDFQGETGALRLYPIPVREVWEIRESAAQTLLTEVQQALAAKASDLIPTTTPAADSEEEGHRL